MPDSPGIKPIVMTETVLPLLQEHFGGAVQNLTAIQGGDVAQAFSFRVTPEAGGNSEDGAAARDYIVQFNPPMPINFEKEAYAYEHFPSPAIPIPRVVHIGRLGELDYAITEKAPGRNLLQIARDEYVALIPQLIEVLGAIHRVPVVDKPGYGIFDGSGVGLSSNGVRTLNPSRRSRQVISSMAGTLCLRRRFWRGTCSSGSSLRCSS